MTETPLVTVITPTHNDEKFIRTCIDSVLGQTYRNWEQIIIDDGSSDHTAEIIRSYADQRIRYFYQENQGIEALAHTYNRALREARGELIAILEADDFWPSEKLARMVPAFADADTILVYGIPHEVDVEGRLTKRLPKQVRSRLQAPHAIQFNDPAGSATAFMLRADGQLISPVAVIIRRAALERIGGFQYVPNLCTTDFPTFVRLSRVGKFCFIPEVMGYYRRHGSWSLRSMDRMGETIRGLISALLVEFGPYLSQEEIRRIQQSWAAGTYMEEYARGRLGLLRKEWRESRRHFRKAISPSSPRVACAAMLGWLLSWFHCNMELLFRLAGRSTYRSLPSN